MREALEIIAQKEQEIRGRLLRARASAASIVAAARAEAEQIRAEGEAAAVAETRMWLDEQDALVRQEAEATVALSTARVDDQRVDEADTDVAVHLILDAVLPGSVLAPGG